MRYPRLPSAPHTVLLFLGAFSTRTYLLSLPEGIVVVNSSILHAYKTNVWVEGLPQKGGVAALPTTLSGMDGDSGSYPRNFLDLRMVL